MTTGPPQFWLRSENGISRLYALFSFLNVNSLKWNSLYSRRKLELDRIMKADMVDVMHSLRYRDTRTENENIMDENSNSLVYTTGRWFTRAEDTTIDKKRTREHKPSFMSDWGVITEIDCCCKRETSSLFGNFFDGSYGHFLSVRVYICSSSLSAESSIECSFEVSVEVSLPRRSSLFVFFDLENEYRVFFILTYHLGLRVYHRQSIYSWLSISHFLRKLLRLLFVSLKEKTWRRKERKVSRERDWWLSSDTSYRGIGSLKKRLIFFFIFLRDCQTSSQSHGKNNFRRKRRRAGISVKIKIHCNSKLSQRRRNRLSCMKIEGRRTDARTSDAVVTASLMHDYREVLR